MKFNLLITALTILALGNAGCNTGKSMDETLQFGGLARTFKIYVPAKYDGSSPVPLLLNLHGYTSNAEEQMYYGDFRPIADTANFIVVHPQGTLYEGQTHWNTGGWTPNSTVDDLGFLNALIDKMQADYKIDPLRIYVTGISNGGEMSYHMACRASNRIAAIASVSGCMTPQTFGNCQPARPVPILHIHGTADQVVPYEGDTTATGVMKGLAFWANLNHCATEPAQTTVPNTNADDNSTVEHYAWASENAPVEHYKIIGGDHTWPGTTYNYPGTNYDINASVEIWKFLSQFDLRGKRF